MSKSNKIRIPRVTSDGRIMGEALSRKRWDKAEMQVRTDPVTPAILTAETRKRGLVIFGQPDATVCDLIKHNLKK